MRKSLTALASAATIAAVASPTTADAGRGWWGPYGYSGAYYNYYQPAPVYYDYYAAPIYYDYVAPRPSYGCWRFRYGYRYRVC
jgi:hypothetical protein